MIRLLWTASVEVRYFLRRYMPSNIVLDVLRTRQGLKWGIPAMLLAVPYLAVAHWCTTLIGDGGPGGFTSSSWSVSGTRSKWRSSVP